MCETNETWWKKEKDLQEKEKKQQSTMWSTIYSLLPFNFFWVHNPFSFNGKFNSPQGLSTRLVNTKPDN